MGILWSVEEDGLRLEQEMAPHCQPPWVFFDFMSPSGTEFLCCESDL